jgi:hypothetical protein
LVAGVVDGLSREEHGGTCSKLRKTA